MTNDLQFILRKWQFFMRSNQDNHARHTLFKDIWQHYYKRLFFFTQNMISVDVEDTVQDIMLKVYQNLEKYKPFYSFNTWIYSIARNHCINLLQKKKLTTQSLEDTKATIRIKSGENTPEKQVIYQEDFQQIENYLNRLEPIYQQMAFLRFYEGLQVKQIAQILDVPPGTVKSRIHLIKKALVKELEK